MYSCKKSILIHRRKQTFNNIGMTKKHLILIIFASLLSFGAIAQTQLSFDNGVFKIAQFTDLHWSDNSPNCEQTINTINKVLEIEQPHLAILTGDVVTAPPAKDGWLRIAKIFEEAKTPWTAVLGNHDEEADLSRDGIFELLKGLPYFVGEKGDNLSGAGNFVLTVNGSDNKASSLIYGIDSHNKPQHNKHGHYDWIHFDQIAWYRQNSESFTKANNGRPLPSLSFFHIPILEYKNIHDKTTTIGNKMEGVASPEINSGIFASFIEMKDVMGVFVGHDHNNDYIGVDQDIALAFGRTTGADAYGKLDRGARIIQMYEDKFQFDTWIRTPEKQEFIYYFPSGISSTDEENLTFLPSLSNASKGKQGLKYTYFEGGSLKKTEDIFTNGKMINKGIVDNFTLAPALVPDSFAFVFEGLIDIPEKAIYNFYTYSDDGSVLYIDDEIVVDNNGSHSLRRKNGKVALDKGLHKIRVEYFDNYMGEFLEVGWSSRAIREEAIPNYVISTGE